MSTRIGAGWILASARTTIVPYCRHTREGECSSGASLTKNRMDPRFREGRRSFPFVVTLAKASAHQAHHSRRAGWILASARTTIVPFCRHTREGECPSSASLTKNRMDPRLREDDDRSFLSSHSRRRVPIRRITHEEQDGSSLPRGRRSFLFVATLAKASAHQAHHSRRTGWILASARTTTL